MSTKQHTIRLLQYKSNIIWHFNVFPFFTFLVGLLAMLFVPGGDRTRIIILCCLCIACLLSGGVCSLLCYWNARARAFMQFNEVSSVDVSSAVLVVPPHCTDEAEIISICRDDTESVWFWYRKEKYVFDHSISSFVKQRYPDDLPFCKYLSSHGLTSKVDVPIIQNRYGLNVMEIDLPSFKKQFLERVLAPMFIFQLFCIVLMCLNGYWFHSVLIILLLLMFETILVVQQQRNMQQIKDMAHTTQTVYIYRDKHWSRIPSTDMLPGDLCAITKTSDREGIVPCDLLLLYGTCIADESSLTGESIPVTKEPVCDYVDESLNTDVHEKLHILHCGTRVIQHQNLSKQCKLKVPHNGCLAYVLRTGFATHKGSLLKTMMVHINRSTRNDFESYVFIMFLLTFALAASIYVWINGRERQGRYKLLLSCITIVTDVIPPELSMELSNAVNCSLLELRKLGIFCTEPYRIPYAGKLDVCCFDKTGTLTSDELCLEGVAHDSEEITAPCDITEEAMTVIAVCHNLVEIDREVVGDPMEKAAVSAIGWTIHRGDNISSKQRGRKSWHIDHRFHFTSALGRMMVIASSEGGSGTRRIICAIKGAPEYLKPMFSDAPSNYAKVANDLAMRGRRVLALGYKELSTTSRTPSSLKRSDLECDMQFAGFMVITSPLKSDSFQVITSIMESNHHVKMITGDDPLTACHVARQLGMCQPEKRVICLEGFDQANGECWKTIGKSEERVAFERFREFYVCLTGKSLDWLNSNRSDVIDMIIRDTVIFARTKPEQKEFILNSLEKSGFYTLMCGDGTNDVGALKRAHVGVALCSVEKPPDKCEAPEIPLAKTKPSLRDSRSTQVTLKSDKQIDLFESDDRIVKLGDASIAAPFTSRGSSINAVAHIIRQGRCTLVTTLQIFKILALNALILAYGRSVLYLQGIKYSDIQATLEGVFIAVAFLGISKSKPVEYLSHERPIPDIINLYTILTILFQSGVHLVALVRGSWSASRFLAYRTDLPIDLEADFFPTLQNSIIFSLVIILQASNFIVNYKGRPFMIALTEHKPLIWTLGSTYFAAIILLSDVIRPVSNYLQLIPLPAKLWKEFLTVIILDPALCFMFDRFLYWALSSRCSKLRHLS